MFRKYRPQWPDTHSRDIRGSRVIAEESIEFLPLASDRRLLLVASSGEKLPNKAWRRGEANTKLIEPYIIALRLC